MSRAVVARDRLVGAGYSPGDAATVVQHLRWAERQRKPGQGFVRVEWLLKQDVDPRRPARCLERSGSFQLWDANRSPGYLALHKVVCEQLARPPEGPRFLVVRDCHPSGALGYWAWMLAAGGLASAIMATSPPLMSHPEGGPAVVGTNPISFGVPSSRPLVVDLSSAEATYGDVLAGRATPDQIRPFGGRRAYKGFALAVGLEMFVGAFAGRSPAVALLLCPPRHDPAPLLRDLMEGRRLPGDRLAA